MEIVQLLFTMAISGIIGYSTNVLAIRSLFRPYEPIKMGPVVFQGLIPKRKKDLASKVADIVAEELLDQEDLIGQLIKKEDEAKFAGFISEKVESVVIEKTAILPGALQRKLVQTVNDQIEKESPKIFSDFKLIAEDQIRNKIDVATLIEEKIDLLDLATIENLIIKVSNRELRAIEWLGLIMGAGIGLIQGIITIYIM